MQKIADTPSVPVTTAPKITKRLKLQEILESPNLATRLNGNELQALGQWVVNGYVQDMSTRTQWTQRHAEAIKLGLQVREAKSFPWTNASNVKFPLVTIAVLQFLARISMLTKGKLLARFEPVGADPEGSKAQRAARISLHTSMQLQDEDVSWMDDDEKAKFSCALLGSAFKKSHFDSVQGTNVSEFVPAQNLVFDYHCRHVDTCSRVTHVLSMDSNRIRERITQGVFLEEDEPSPPGRAVITNLLDTVKDEIQGLWPSANPEEFRVLEQHAWFDFDGDGYAEPYIFSVREDTGHVFRIVARFFDDGSIHRRNDVKVQQADSLALKSQDRESRSKHEKEAHRLQNDPANAIVRIDPVKYFTKYTFIPSPDGGAYGLGLGALLGPVNEAVDSLINQLIDAGTMSNTAGGFLGRGVKLKGGKNTFDPFEWKIADVTGDDLRKGIFPLPVREPSSVLFQLLGILITYGEKIGSATDVMTGVSPGQNTPAETSRNTVEQGMMLFSGIFIRMYRGFREELRKLYELNRLYLHLSPNFFALTEGPDAILMPDDYAGGRFRVFPSADPSTVSGQQRKDKADKLAAFVQSPLGGKMDKDAVTRYWLEAHDYDVEVFFPDPKGPRAIQPPPNPKVMLEQQKMQQQGQQHQDEMMLEAGKLKAVMALNEGKIAQLSAQATLAIAKADGVDKAHEIALIDAQIGAARAHNESLAKAADLLLKAHQARSTIEGQHHDRLMDVHDRLTQKAADDREQQQQKGEK